MCSSSSSSSSSSNCVVVVVVLNLVLVVAVVVVIEVVINVYQHHRYHPAKKSYSICIDRNNRRRRIAKVFSLRRMGDAHSGRILQVHGRRKQVRVDTATVRRPECAFRVETVE